MDIPASLDAARRASALRGLRARFPCVPAAADSPDGAAASSEPFFESHPSLYPRGSRHGPRHRTDTLLAASLKLGAFNTLALLVVAWSAMLGPALPILFSVGPPLRGSFARDFLCNEAFRDARALLKLLALVVAWAASPWLLVRAHCAGLINPAALVVCHFAALATLAGAAAAVLLVGHQLAPLYGMQGGLLCVIAALKAHSFVFTHLAPLKAPPAPVPQAPPPSAAAYVYFMLAPTLCWEARGFPTAKRVRWAHAVGWLACAVGAASAQYFVLREMLLPVLTEEPTVAAAFPALPGVFAAAAAFFVDLARLAVPSLFFWLLVFFGVFVGWLNLLGEVMRFSDHRFYLPWWTATSLSEFWRRWNWPVHLWCERHLLIDAQVYLSVTRRGGVAITFFVSALLHELILGCAFRTLRPYFFGAMLLQLPLITLSHLVRGPRAGNAFVWLSLWLGQPLLHLLYARDFAGRGHDAHAFFCLP